MARSATCWRRPGSTPQAPSPCFWRVWKRCECFSNLDLDRTRNRGERRRRPSRESGCRPRVSHGPDPNPPTLVFAPTARGVARPDAPGAADAPADPAATQGAALLLGARCPRLRDRPPPRGGRGDRCPHADGTGRRGAARRAPRRRAPRRRAPRRGAVTEVPLPGGGCVRAEPRRMAANRRARRAFRSMRATRPRCARTCVNASRRGGDASARRCRARKKKKKKKISSRCGSRRTAARRFRLRPESRAAAAADAMRGGPGDPGAEVLRKTCGRTSSWRSTRPARDCASPASPRRSTSTMRCSDVRRRALGGDGCRAGF